MAGLASKMLLVVVLGMLFCGSVQSETEKKVESVASASVKYIYFVFTPQCYNSLVQELNVTDFGCIKLTLSKCLGYALVSGGAIVKVPQIIKIFL